MSPHKIAIVGCGNIGAGWAAIMAARGLRVACTDPAPGAEARLRAAVAAELATLGLDPEQIAAAEGCLSFTPDLAAALDGCEWVQENAPEALDLKRGILRAIDALVPPSVVIASSTSGIMPSVLQAGLSHPERLIAGHPFLPVSLIALVEVVGGSLTSPAVVDRAMAFYAAIGKAPVRVVRERTGHIANRLQAAVMREAFHLLAEGIASAADIDRALTEGPGQRWAATGPFVSQHLAGGPGGAAATFAHLGDALRAMWADLGAPTLDAALQQTVEAGIAELLAETPAEEWAARRTNILTLLARAKSGGQAGRSSGQ